ncbi:hypothetical protein GCM10022224_071070 [Nonomuraea antimicrobica]|uniref:Uncharacterized protein n=1 Tax=Nonomuraea antimicrobica TaxID=561173 RepID=A0ABP7CV35_9ACTN
MLTRDLQAAADEIARGHAADLQRRARGWFVVMYSLYWRRLVAIYTGHSDHGVLLHAASPDELWQQMNRVAPPDWQAADLPALSSAGLATVAGSGSKLPLSTTAPDIRLG